MSIKAIHHSLTVSFHRCGVRKNDIYGGISSGGLCVTGVYSAMGLYVKASYSQSSRETCSLACFASGKHANQPADKEVSRSLKLCGTGDLTVSSHCYRGKDC